MRSLVVLVLCVAATHLRADTITLTSGQVLSNVSIVKLTGDSVRYRQGTALQSVPYKDIASLQYGQIKSTGEEKRLRKEMKTMRTRPPSVSSSFARIGSEWDSLEEENQSVSKRLGVLSKDIMNRTAKGNSSADERNSLNALLARRDKLEKRLQEVRTKQRQLAEDFLRLAAKMGIQLKGERDATKDGQSNNEPGETSNAFSGPWRSALIPGWGQYHHQRYGAALLWFSTAIIATTYLKDVRADYESARTTRNAALSLALLGQTNASSTLTLAASFAGRAAQQRMEVQREQNNTGLGLFALIYCVNVWDAFYSDGLFSISRNSAGTVSASYQFRF